MEEDRTIPICRVSIALLAALPALGTAVPALASDAELALAEYARARVADASGEIERAAQGYANALNSAPFDEALATRAFRRAVAAGEKSLALEAAHILANGGALPPDGEFLFLIEALDNGDWAGARQVVDRIEDQQIFQSLAPLLRAWITFGAQDDDPFAHLSAAPGNFETTAYAREHRALLLIARGNHEQGIAELESIEDLPPPAELRLRIAGAATLARNGQRGLARDLVDRPGRAYTETRALIERRRDVPGAVDTASKGIAQLMVRLASDIGQRNVDSLALALGRYSTFLAPDNAIARLVTAAILSNDEQYGAALDAVSQIGERDPFYAEAQDMRVRFLVEQGRAEQALAIAAEQAGDRNADSSDWLRVGGLYSQLERHGEAAQAFEQALGGDEPGEDESWSTWLLYGSALLDAGQWEAARPVLDKSLELAPDQPVVLNYVGYALLERRQELERAEELIRRASEMQPDSAAITDSLGWVQYVRGDLDQAIPTLERAALGDPDEPTINEHLGDAYWTVGRRRDARFAWQAALVSAEDEAVSRIEQKLDFGLTPETASP